MKLQMPRPYLNAYHLEKNLLFQFILSEFLLIHVEVSLIAKVVSDEDQATYQSYLKPFHQLIGLSQSYMRFFAWTYEEGRLAKFLVYCHQFSQSEFGSRRITKGLTSATHRAWLLCLNCLDVLRQHKEKPQHQLFYSLMKKASQRFLQVFSRVQELVPRIVEEMPLNENVLFFILCHQRQLDEIYGNSFVYQLFQKLFAGGIAEGRRYLETRYLNRGFSHLMPIISTKMAQLAEDP